MWTHWINGLLGIWLIVLPFVGFTVDTMLTWTLVITGILVAVFGFWGAALHQGDMAHSRRMA